MSARMASVQTWMKAYPRWVKGVANIPAIAQPGRNRTICTRSVLSTDDYGMTGWPLLLVRSRSLGVGPRCDWTMQIRPPLNTNACRQAQTFHISRLNRPLSVWLSSRQTSLVAANSPKQAQQWGKQHLNEITSQTHPQSPTSAAPSALSTTKSEFASLQTDTAANTGSSGVPIGTPTATQPLRWSPPPTFSLSVYSSLSKAGLALYVVLTAACGYALAPTAASLPTLFWCTLGTSLCVASANSFNQWAESPFDAQMRRTRTRPLVRHTVSPVHAWLFGVSAAFCGTSVLFYFVNAPVAVLGALNIALYAAIYTPLKRVHISNTWIGAVVGAIPPVMGYLAADPTSLTTSFAPWVLAATLYSWQFPHFNGLSWNLVPDYSKAGYRMMAVTDPDLTTRVALRHSIALLLIGWAAPFTGVVGPLYAVTSTVPNGALLYLAYRFHRHADEKTARKLFFGSLFHLLFILALMMVHKPDKIDAYSGSADENETLPLTLQMEIAATETEGSRSLGGTFIR
ncbi:Protoheme IX farnesyltransferase, mitochondrial [Gonapodya sp. JEL0774]|nr:Protoheme IX farnesyltransferase, mitochondrial [Gonapodya sp. JEL0774]